MEALHHQRSFLMQRRRKMAPTKGFLQLSSLAIWAQCWNLPTSPVPHFLLAQKLSPKDIGGSENTSWNLHAYMRLLHIIGEVVDIKTSNIGNLYYVFFQRQMGVALWITYERVRWKINRIQLYTKYINVNRFSRVSIQQTFTEDKDVIQKAKVSAQSFKIRRVLCSGGWDRIRNCLFDTTLYSCSHSVVKGWQCLKKWVLLFSLISTCSL